MRLSESLVRAKLRLIVSDLKRLQKVVSQRSYESLVTDEPAMTLCERYLERIVNRAIDVNFHLIRSYGEQAPRDYTESFLILGRLKILPSKFAVRIAPSAGARNILVHEYDDLDTKLFYSAIIDCLKQYPMYVKYIEKSLEKQK